MKAASRSRKLPVSKTRFDARSATYPLSQAKTFLGRLLEKAGNGETVYIVRGQRRFVLQPLAEIEPIPLRPPGYFAGDHTRGEIERDNRLSEASVVEKPSDLE